MSKTHFKKCNKCLIVKDVSFFSKESRAKNGFKPRCKECSNKALNEWRTKNPGYMDAKMKVYYQKNADQIKKRVAVYAEKNRDRIKLYNNEYRKNNREKLNKKTLEYITDKIKSDPDFRLLRLHRKLIHRLQIEKNGRTSELLGYSHEDLLKALGRYPNNNEHIDHKVPITCFEDLTDYKIINNLENLQILSASENLRKSNKYCHPVSENYYREILPKIKNEFKQKILCEHITND